MKQKSSVVKYVVTKGIIRPTLRDIDIAWFEAIEKAERQGKKLMLNKRIYPR